MVDLMHYLTDLLFFSIPLLYCYIILNSSIICCLSSGDMYLFYVASISSFCNSLGDFFECKSVEPFIILSEILLPIKPPVGSAGFFLLLFSLFEAVFIASAVDFQHDQEVFDHIYCLNFYPCFQQKTKIGILLHLFSRFN